LVESIYLRKKDNKKAQFDAQDAVDPFLKNPKIPKSVKKLKKLL